MNTLIIWRHADYDANGLTQDGIADVAALSARLSTRHRGQRVRIRTSSANRAWETGKIVAKAYGCEDLEKSSILLCTVGEEIREQQLLEFITGNGDNIDVLILVTHLEICRDLPTAFGRLHDIRVPRLDVQRGEAVVLDLVNKTYGKL
jgi:phosphohistidine phosphatase SixA